MRGILAGTQTLRDKKPMGARALLVCLGALALPLLATSKVFAAVDTLVIEQADGTGWMAMYSLNLLAIAMELASEDPAYEDVASKFFEHFVYICRAMNNIGGEKIELWDREDGFFYDVLHLPNGETKHLKVRSMVGLIPLFAVETLDPELIDKLPGFKRRLQWFMENRPELSEHIETESTDDGPRRFLSLVNRHRLRSVCAYLLDPEEFLSDFGIRAVSRFHREGEALAHGSRTGLRRQASP